LAYRTLIGVDLDGVLGDQVSPILTQVSARGETLVTYDQVESWRHPVGSSDISTLIVAAQRSEPTYISDMPLHLGAREMLSALRELGEVAIVTARPPEIESQTVSWLRRNDLPYDRFYIAEEAGKSVHGCDVLVDDYSGNIEEFLASTNGYAVLVDQPWNRTERVALLASGRCDVAFDLQSVPGLVREAICAPT
jgi:5'(3')-deoxyribonucleotidase